MQATCDLARLKKKKRGKLKLKRMNLTIDLSNQQLAAVKAKAAPAGLTPEDWIRRLAERETENATSAKPFKSGYGIPAKYGSAPSAEEIEENRREMLRSFAED